jgi:hypothetical protein
MTVSNFSHTNAEIRALEQEGKQINIKITHMFGVSFGSLVSITQGNILLFQLMVQNDFGDGLKLYYFCTEYYPDNRTIVSPYIINTTAMGG